jgi:hypothetical protein
MPDLHALLVHEAAHAVVAHSLGATITQITLLRDPAGSDWGGGVHAPGLTDDQRAIVALAGPTVDELIAGRPVDDWDADHQKASDAVGGSTEAFDKARERAGREVNDQLASIQAVARALESYADPSYADSRGRTVIGKDDVARILREAAG